MAPPTRPTRHFNTSGPCRPEKHYLLPPSARLPEARRLIDEERYFVLHAARQTGKTTAVRALAEELRAQGMVALHATLETSRQVPDVVTAEPRWLQTIEAEAHFTLPLADRPPPTASVFAGAPGTRFGHWLGLWAAALQPRPLVLFLDEVDSIEGEAMVNFLAQLRAGFNRRPTSFPASIVLVGLRDLKDYLVAAKDGQRLNAGSPFNIKAESITLRPFTIDEVRTLYAQHTGDTGQPFTEDAIARAFYWSVGQPFLVNAIAYHLTRREPVPLERAIAAADVDRAEEHLVLSRTTHLDNLTARLEEKRVADVMRPILLGEGREQEPPRDDLDYCFDLGLVRRGPHGLEPANPLYREVLARALADGSEMDLPEPRWPWRRPDGRLDFPALVSAFFHFWRQNGGVLVNKWTENWREAAAHIAVMAWVSRVVNGGGAVHREYAAGRGALDLLVEYGGERNVIEIKRVRAKHDTVDVVIDLGATQLAAYLDTLGLSEGWLFVFDLDSTRSWDERLYQRELERDGKRIHVRGG